MLLTNGSIASRSLSLLLLRFKCDNFGHSWSAWRPLLMRLSLSSNFFKLANLGNPLRVVRPTLIRLKVSKLTYSSDNPSICVALALSKLSSLICKKDIYFSNKSLNLRINYAVKSKISAILGSFHYLPQWLKATFFNFFFQTELPLRGLRRREKLKK